VDLRYFETLRYFEPMQNNQINRTIFLFQAKHSTIETIFLHY